MQWEHVAEWATVGISLHRRHRTCVLILFSRNDSLHQGRNISDFALKWCITEIGRESPEALGVRRVQQALQGLIIDLPAY